MRTRISLDVDPQFKRDIMLHGAAVDAFTLTASLHAAVARSLWLAEMQKRGVLLVAEGEGDDETLTELTPP